MKPNNNMEAVIGKKRYRVATATLLAHDEYWDGHNLERYGHNTYLYRTPSSRYFAVHLTMWQGEQDYIEPMSVEDAYDLYEGLPEKETKTENAFPMVKIIEA